MKERHKNYASQAALCLVCGMEFGSLSCLLNECVGFRSTKNIIVLYLSYRCCPCYMYHHANDNWPIGQY